MGDIVRGTRLLCESPLVSEPTIRVNLSLQLSRSLGLQNGRPAHVVHQLDGPDHAPSVGQSTLVNTTLRANVCGINFYILLLFFAVVRSFVRFDFSILVTVSLRGTALAILLNDDD